MVSSKINVSKIIKDHWNSLVDFNKKKHSRVDILTFFVGPTIFGIIALAFNADYSARYETFLNYLVTSMSIFAALLFNFLLLIYDEMRKLPSNSKSAKYRLRLLKETHANVSFCILISILVIVFIILYIIGPGFKPQVTRIIDFAIPFLHYIKRLIAFLIISLTGIFIASLLMILKRIYTIVGLEPLLDSEPEKLSSTSNSQANKKCKK